MIRGRVVDRILLVTLILAWPARAGSAAPIAATTSRAPPPPPRVAVVAPAASDDEIVVEAVSRLRLELAAAGLREPDSAQPPEYTVAIVRADDQLIAEVQRTGARGSASPARRFALATTTDPDPASVAAIRTVELLRAIILEAATPVEPSRAVIAAQAVPVAVADQAHAPIDPGRPFQAGFGVAALQSFGGINTGFGLTARMGGAVGRSLSVELKLVGPTFARERQVVDGTMSVFQMMAALGLGYSLGAQRWLQPSLSVMGGVYLGEFGITPSTGQSGSVEVTTPFVSVGAGLAVLTWDNGGSLRLEADAVFLEHPAHVTSSGTDVGRTGRPLLLVSLRFERAAALHKWGR